MILIAKRAIMVAAVLLPQLAWAGSYGSGTYGAGGYSLGATSGGAPGAVDPGVAVPSVVLPGLGTLPVTGATASILAVALVLAIVAGLMTRARLQRNRQQDV